MLSSVRLPIVTSYSVEVSGWDAAQTFFVEKAELEWSERSGKQVHLRRSLRDGSLLFIRLIRSDVAAHSHPVPYEAESLGTNHKGQFGFRLHAVLPNGSEEPRRAA